MNYLLQSPYTQPALDQYSGTDARDRFTANCARFGKNWRFHDTPITYKRNSGGYRMKEFSDIDYSNYIAFFGCSFTEGIGLALEDTFAWRIAQKLGLGENYVNAAIGGSSPLFVIQNLLSLINSAPLPPSTIVINWPPIHRTHYWWKDQARLMMPTAVLPYKLPGYDYWRPVYERTITEDSHVILEFKTIVAQAELICRAARIQLIQMSTMPFYRGEWPPFPGIPQIPLRNGADYSMEELLTVPLLNKFLGRDIGPQLPTTIEQYAFLAHPGIYHQDCVVEHFFRRYNSLVGP